MNWSKIAINELENVLTSGYRGDLSKQFGLQLHRFIFFFSIIWKIFLNGHSLKYSLFMSLQIIVILWVPNSKFYAFWWSTMKHSTIWFSLIFKSRDSLEKWYTGLHILKIKLIITYDCMTHTFFISLTKRNSVVIVFFFLGK